MEHTQGKAKGGRSIHNLLLALALLCLIGTANAATNVSACGYLNGANTVFNLTQNISTDVDTCITFNATNQTLNCNGYTVKSTYSSGYGAYSAFNRSQLNNCIINSTVLIGVRLSGSHYSTINNSQIYARMGTGFQTTAGDYLTMENTYVRGWVGITTGSHSRFRNVTAIATLTTNNGLFVSDQTSNNTFTNCSAISTATGNGLHIARSQNNTFANGYIQGAHSTQGALMLYDGSTGNTIQNNTINGMGNIGMTFWGIAAAGRNTNNNQIINNTFTNSTTHLKIITLAANNTFCLNNFSHTGTTPTYYINDTNGSNLYNCTYASMSQGNIYENVVNGSVEATGVNVSSITGLVVGKYGSGVPYTSTTSGGMLLCPSASCIDYAPLTPFPTIPIVNEVDISSSTRSDAGANCTVTATLPEGDMNVSLAWYRNNVSIRTGYYYPLPSATPTIIDTLPINSTSNGEMVYCSAMVMAGLGNTSWYNSSTIQADIEYRPMLSDVSLVVSQFLTTYGGMLMLIVVLLVSRLLARSYSQLLLGIAGGSAAIYVVTQQPVFLLLAILLGMAGTIIKLVGL